MIYCLFLGKQELQEDADSQDEGEELGGIFRAVKKKQEKQLEEKDTKDGEECSKFPETQLMDWMQSEVSRGYYYSFLSCVKWLFFLQKYKQNITLIIKSLHCYDSNFFFF